MSTQDASYFTVVARGHAMVSAGFMMGVLAYERCGGRFGNRVGVSQPIVTRLSNVAWLWDLNHGGIVNEPTESEG